MFGDNPIRSADPDPTSLKVQSAFYTIQGEGPQAGRPALFIRLAGCNLACTFCDTEFESGMANDYRIPTFVEELCQQFSREQRRFVVLTGGEPMRQAGATSLMAQLLASGTEFIQIETAGTLWLDGLQRYIEGGLVQLVCSPKTPRVHMNVALHCDHWKYVVKAGELDLNDGLPRRGTQLKTREQLQTLYRPIKLRHPDSQAGAVETIWLSPMDEYDAQKNRANMEAARDACLRYGYRLSLQIHKLIEVE